MLCTLNESFLFDWGCLVSNSNTSNNPIAKMALVYVAMLFPTHSFSLLVFLTQPGWKVVPLLSFLSHNWWTVATHSDCTVIKLNSADVQTAKVQTMWLIYFTKSLTTTRRRAMPFRNVLNDIMRVVATRWVSLSALLLLDRFKYFTTAFTNPLVSCSSLLCLFSDSSTSESVLYRNISTQMHTIV